MRDWGGGAREDPREPHVLTECRKMVAMPRSTHETTRETLNEIRGPDTNQEAVTAPAVIDWLHMFFRSREGRAD